MMSWGHMTGGGWALTGVVSLVIVVLLTILVVRAFAGRTTTTTDGTDRARGILAERFARGEIGVEEYRERLDELNERDLRSGERR